MRANGSVCQQSRSSVLMSDGVAELAEVGGVVVVDGDSVGHTPARVQNRGVVAAAEGLADALQWRVGELAHQVDGELPCPGDLAETAGTGEVGDREAEVLGDDALD